MAELKTSRNDGDVDAFIASVEDDVRRSDARKLKAVMEEVTGEPAAMWGTSIVGFGEYRYRAGTGREAEWFKVGFSPRKRESTLYIMTGFEGSEELLGSLGPHRTGKACLYIKRLEDVDHTVLHRLIEGSLRQVEANELE